MASTEPFDVNFCLPVRELESDKVKLTPFIPSIHSELVVNSTIDYPDVWKYLPSGPFNSVEAFTEYFMLLIARDPKWMLYAVYDKGSSSNAEGGAAETFAGTIGFLATYPDRLSTEIGLVITLPRFQRTHVTTHATGLLLQYALELSPQGLGLRRVQWKANANNAASIRAAQRLGFKLEGVRRWQMALAPHKKGAGNNKVLRDGDPRPGYDGRDTAMLSLCWDDWEQGGREHVQWLMSR
ncbi:acyl-CoA N-acyltransferase [Punctularia strigosozonata HHB-11173 SS5]|uniref:acyl-CoA N-acyltransferase n=1 Tax=Punctularia strigosozonata (strain HHB-11173) TaxID=741275 RepID=UPI0004418518|nr:acyl-CoA N-acyltransferase [Punctularia strigosozonata HHB-11173 SS5]EIN06820.1 acyl-CoA N-acyltransferase [Punctularia strigosozonata HHB-11173 SS5]